MSDDEIIDAEDLDPAMLIEVDPDAEVLDADSIGLEGDDESFELTDDLAAEDTLEEVEEIYFESWKLGIKAVALYRDGCKMSQPSQRQQSPRTRGHSRERRRSSCAMQTGQSSF